MRQRGCDLCGGPVCLVRTFPATAVAVAVAVAAVAVAAGTVAGAGRAAFVESLPRARQV